MKKVLSAFFIAVLVLFSIRSSVWAAPSPTSTPQINSFEMFWPVTAGRTIDDSLYFLKSLKEKVREFLIFGKAQKVDYEVFLSTKRIVEVEKLIGENKVDAAKKTLDVMVQEIESASSNLAASGGLKGVNIDTINQRLDNLETFISYLSAKSTDLRAHLNGALEKVRNLNSRI